MSVIAAEAARAVAHSRRIITEYERLRSRIEIGDIQQYMYTEILEFVNMRVETADSCLILIENRRIADCLGLCRALLENYLLLMLMCRGSKFFKIQPLEPDIKAKDALQEEQAKLAAAHQEGREKFRVEVKLHPRFKKQALMHIFEGLRGKDEPDFVVPWHYFVHQEFDPDIMRLKIDNYFSHLHPSLNEPSADKEGRKEASDLYRYFLSYSALIDCLTLNGILDKESEARLEAHYTFLGKYLHPTHGAARQLHEQNNQYFFHTGVGLSQSYSELATLLAATYVAYCLTGVIEEAVKLLDNAPKRYIANPGTSTLHNLIEATPIGFSYFWFVFNDAPLWDKFKYATYRATNEELTQFGHYSKIPSDRIKFDNDILGHLSDSLGNAYSARCGQYVSPIGPN
ncbi:hypothetical protein EDC02_3472 [Micromonospora sp. Llam0]|uniref:hypothetical protein n=1 Tax=Micromonospora sp. Llam0 TaxID=2485143 RepID=UPI000FBD1FA4|nr:hypothetical protein [Micromonospora sp. Llam0]ROO61533.1 hypothetical protein EDC02_3472 [Micromonospora sp. Llam0]